MENGNRGSVRSVGRALTLLELLSLEERGIGIAEISRRIELPISTCHRLLTTLISHGFVAQDDETGSYSVGLRAFEVGNAFSYQTSLGKEALPFMSMLLAEVNETINLRVLDGSSAVLVQQVKSEHLLSMNSRSGTRIPLYCSAVGKVLLAGLSDDRIDAYLKLQERDARTEKTLVDRKALLAEVGTIRASGYALDDGEFEQGVRCVAAPISNRRGETVGTVGVSGPTSRITDERLASVISEVQNCASTISNAVSGGPPRSSSKPARSVR